MSLATRGLTPFALCAVLALGACDVADDTDAPRSFDPDAPGDPSGPNNPNNPNNPGATDTDASGGDDTDPTGDTDPGDTDVDDTDLPPCVSGIDFTIPADGDTEFLVDGELRVRFDSNESTTATLELFDDAGDLVPATLSFNGPGRIATLVPDDDLERGEDYRLEINYSCGGFEEVSFTTSMAGLPVGDPTILPDGVFYVDLESPSLVVLEPLNIGFLGPLFAGFAVDLLVSPHDYDALAETLSFRAAFGEEVSGQWEQDVCQLSFEFEDPSDFTTNPHFEVNGATIQVEVLGEVAELFNVELKGTFVPDGQSIVNGEFAGTINAEEVVDGVINALNANPLVAALINAVFPGGLTGIDACDLIASLPAGGGCTDCGDGTLECIDVRLGGIVMPRVAETGLLEVTQDDIDADATCAVAPPTP